MEIEKLKVADLRAALGGRGLDTKGTKPILVQRLKEAIAQDGAPQSEPAATESVAQDAEQSTAPLEVQDDDAMEEAPAEAVANASTDVQEAEMEETANQTTEETVADVSASEPQDQEMKTEESTKETPAKNEKPTTSTPSQNNNQQRRGQKRKLKEDEPFVVHENEPEIDESVICLDWFNSDLSMRIDKNTMMIGEPFHKDGWGYVWSGAKATHGFNSGSVCYEVKLLDELETKVEPAVHELRLGWSTDDTDMQLGESATSFTYSGSAKKGTDCKFEDYGESFKKDDVIGAFVNLDGPNVVITFTKNGATQGVAFEFPKEQLAGKALFPHVSSRNYKFEVNFGNSVVCEKDDAERPHYTIKAGGEAKEPWFAALEGYTSAALAENKVRNVPRIGKREDCEMIMLIGLPGCGKTTWVNKFVAEHPEKRYNVIGTAALVEKMKVNGESLKKHHDGKWDQLIQKCTRCLQEWLRMASQRRRNVVVDQTNVYPNAQKRKVRPFEGMIRKAIVIVPSDEDYKARIEAQEKEETKDVPDNAVMEMKANFTLPDEGTESPFKEITFVELQREEASKLVEKYNKDAKEKGFGKKNENKQNKKMRGGKMGAMRSGMMRMRGMRGMPGMRGPRPTMRAMMMRGRGGPFMRGGPPGPMRGMMRGMPPMRGGPMMMRGGPGGPPHPARSGPMGPGGPRDGGRMMNKGNLNKGGVKTNQRQGNMTNNRAAGAGNNRTGNMGNQRQGNVGNQRQGNMGNQNRMSGGPAGRGPVGGNAQRNMRGPMNNGGNAGQMNQMNRFSGNKFGGNQMRGGNQGGPSPWQQGSVPQQQQQQFHPQQQQQQQRQYPQQNPQMMQQRPQQQQQGNWGGNPAWGNQGGQGQMMGGGGGYGGNMAGNGGGMNQGMRGMNQGGMNQPWSGPMGNPQGPQMRQQPQQAWGGGGPNHQGGQGYPGSQQWGGFNR